MDSRDNFLIKFKEYIDSINDDYLIGVTNKGIFNRAVKDLGNGGEVKITLEEEAVKCEFPDGSTCSVKEDVKKFKCSCPSRTVCKHVIMSYLYLKQNFKEIFPEAEESQGQSPCPGLDGSGVLSQGSDLFSGLLLIDIPSIKKEIGDRDFGSIARRLQFGLKAGIEEGSLLLVNFMEEDITVKFLPAREEEEEGKIDIKDSLSVLSALCSCKSRDICRHKAEAVIHYSLCKGKITAENVVALVKSENSIDKSALSDVLKQVKKLIGEIFTTGLTRMPENFEDTIEQMAVICHNGNLPNLERSLRALQVELHLYLTKNASFSAQNFRKLAQRIFNKVTELENCTDMKRLQKLVGEHKTAYYDIPPLELKSVGARGWRSKSGYEGITFYFINSGFDRFFTYTNSRPTFYDDQKVVNIYEQSSPWGTGGRCSEFGRSHIKLYNGKVNDEYRLSSSEQIRGEVIGRTSVEDIKLHSRVVDNWTSLLARVSEIYIADFSEREENDNLFFLKADSFGASSFDSIHQVFSMPVYDKEHRRIDIKINYNNESKRLIGNLEKMERNKSFPSMLLCEAYLGEESITVFPVTAYYENGKLENWTLE